jgi:hypothetical protein
MSLIEDASSEEYLEQCMKDWTDLSNEYAVSRGRSRIALGENGFASGSGIQSYNFGNYSYNASVVD